MKIFVSYRRGHSSDMVGRIDDHLRMAFGDDSVFRDVDSIPFGDDFVEHIRQALNETDVFLVVIGSDFLTRGNLRNATDYVRIELDLALASRVQIVPVLVNGARMPPAGFLPISLRPIVTINAVTISSDRNFRIDIDRLIRSIGNQTRKSDTSSGHEVVGPPSPRRLHDAGASRLGEPTTFDAVESPWHAEYPQARSPTLPQPSFDQSMRPAASTSSQPPPSDGVAQQLLRETISLIHHWLSITLHLVGAGIVVGLKYCIDLLDSQDVPAIGRRPHWPRWLGLLCLVNGLLLFVFEAFLTALVVGDVYSGRSSWSLTEIIGIAWLLLLIAFACVPSLAQGVRSIRKSQRPRAITVILWVVVVFFGAFFWVLFLLNANAK